MSDPAQRRSSPRRQFSCKARFRDPQALDADSERSCITRDFSRDGVYFVADDRGLRENMKLLLRFPERSAEVQDREYLVEIMRMNALPKDRCGVGARLILRAMVDRCAELIEPKVDLSKYGCLYPGSQRLVDLYA